MSLSTHFEFANNLPIFLRHFVCRASLNDLEIIIASDEVETFKPNYADILNANLVYLCERNATYAHEIVDCHGIGN